MTKPKTITNYRNAKNGQFVPEDYAKKHPETTVKEINKVPAKSEEAPKKK